jgi:hypothetical protein
MSLEYRGSGCDAASAASVKEEGLARSDDAALASHTSARNNGSSGALVPA